MQRTWFLLGIPLLGNSGNLCFNSSRPITKSLIYGMMAMLLRDLLLNKGSLFFINKHVKHILLERAVAFEICMSINLNGVSFSYSLYPGPSSQGCLWRSCPPLFLSCNSLSLTNPPLSLSKIKPLWFTKVKTDFYIRSLPSCPNLWSWVPWELTQMQFILTLSFWVSIWQQVSNSGWGHFLCLFPILFTPTSMLCVKHLC